MPARQKINSVVMVGVAVAFQWFFMFTKHDPGLRPVIPFGDDPYDALGSFASIVNIFLCLLLLWRSFRPYGGRLPSPVQIQYLRRTQAAVPLLILVTLAADAVAMARHPRMWIGSQDKLLALLAGMMVISSVAIWLVLSSMPEPRPPRRRKQMIAPAIAIALFLLILAFYPEHLIGRLFTHLVTVLIGDLLLFVPVSILLRFLLPDPQSSRGGRAPTRVGSVLVWTGGILAALLIGVWLFLSEMNEGGGPLPPPRLRLIVASVYIGLTLAGMLIAVAFLRRPLGLGQGKPAPSIG